MCGISGIISSKNILRYKPFLEQSLNTIKHRGPDDSGEWWAEEDNVGLGHRRLAIIDLSPLGHQPMMNLQSDLCIIFNGEIYNYIDLKNELIIKGHKFKSQSDTEVVMASYKEWGADCLERFNGMFSLAIYDKIEKTIFLARDRAGEKPLFYSFQNETLIFASELKALLVYPFINKILNPIGLDCYLSMGFVPGELCIIEGINKLPPAHAMLYDLKSNTLKKWQYWTLPELDNEVVEGNYNTNNLIDELEYLLEDAVKRQMISDVPLGILLSGGVDSSLITSMAARSGNKIKTFTVGFPNHSKFDERSHARLIANYFDTDHTELHASEVSINLLPKLAKQYDEPIIDSSMIPTYLVSQLIKQHCSVALGGDGGDELFGGYGHHDRLLKLYDTINKIPNVFRNPISKLANKLPVGFKGRVWLQSLNENLETGLPLIASYFDPEIREKLLTKNFLPIAEQIRSKRIPDNNDLLQRITRMDFFNYLPEDILVKVDRASMLNSLEVRAPLLDYRIIEFAYKKVPSGLKTTTFDRKILLKKLTSRVLPPEFDKKRKQGFGIPLEDWLRKGGWNQFMREVLLDSSFFNQEIIEKLISGHENGRNNTERLFGLIMFELWLKEFNIKI